MKTMTKTAGKTATSKSVANAKAGKAVRTLSLHDQVGDLRPPRNGF